MYSSNIDFGKVEHLSEVWEDESKIDQNTKPSKWLELKLESNKTAENLPLFSQIQDGFVASALLGTKGQQLFVLKGLEPDDLSIEEHNVPYDVFLGYTIAPLMHPLRSIMFSITFAMVECVL